MRRHEVAIETASSGHAMHCLAQQKHYLLNLLAFSNTAHSGHLTQLQQYLTLKVLHFILHSFSLADYSTCFAEQKCSTHLPAIKKAKEEFRIGELNPGLVGTDHLSMIESDKS